MPVVGPLTRLHFLVKGRVQGIGYRWFVRERAEALGLGGWVRNNPDGTVEGEAEGDGAALERFGASLREGPPHARVDGVDSRPVAAQGGKTFEIR